MRIPVIILRRIPAKKASDNRNLETFFSLFEKGSTVVIPTVKRNYEHGRKLFRNTSGLHELNPDAVFAGSNGNPLGQLIIPVHRV